MPEKKPWWVSFGAELFIVVGLMFTCRVAVADWPKVPSGSMEPTLRVGDYLLVNHLAYGPRLPFTNTAIELGQPQRGDVVVFRYPLDVSEFYVKRLIGLPGDVVRFDAGAVSVNGAPFDVKVVSEGADANAAPEDRGQWLLRETAAGESRTIKVNPFVMGRLSPEGMGANCTSLARRHRVAMHGARGRVPDDGRQPRQLGRFARLGLPAARAGLRQGGAGAVQPARPVASVPAAMRAPLDLAGKHIVLGLSGGIACYKAADFTRELVKAGATVQVVMTAAAEAFITPVTMQALSTAPSTRASGMRASRTTWRTST